jgi:hypothetical protein
MSGLTTEVSTARGTRSKRPERIDIGFDILVRNDLVARELGTSERTVNRGDAQGAPYTFIGGIKYRPERAYREYLAGRIHRKNQQSRKRRRLSHT